MHKQLLLLFGCALITAAPAQGGNNNLVASMDGRATLSDGGLGTASLKLRLDQYAKGADTVLRGRLDFRYDDGTGKNRITASFKPHGDDSPLTGTLSVSGGMALYIGPGEIVTASGKKPSAVIMIVTDRHDGKSPGPGSGDSMWMIVSPDDGTAGFSYAGLVSSGDIVLKSQS